MTRGHAESAIKTTNGKVSIALTADNSIICLMLVCLAEVLQLMLRPVVTLLHTRNCHSRKQNTPVKHKIMAYWALLMSQPSKHITYQTAWQKAQI